MKLVRALLIPFFVIPFLAALTACAAPAAAPSEDDGWQAFGHALTLVQTLVGIAARSDDPQASLKGIDDVLAGKNPETNAAVAGLLQDATADMPAQYRDKVVALGRDLTAMARRDIAKGPSQSADSVERSLQARKDLTAMGLNYYDAKQFLDAVKRDDTLAAELYILGSGVNLSARDADGRSAADIARANKNARLTELLARNLPAAR